MMANLLQGIGQAQPVTGFINEALKYQEAQSENARRAEMTKLLQQKAAMEEAKYKKDNAEYHIDGALSQYPEHVRPILKKALTMSGRVSNNVVLGVDMRGIPDLIHKDPALAMSVNQADLDWNLKEAERLGKKEDKESKEKALFHSKEAANLTRLIDKGLGEKTKLTVAAPGSDVLDAKGEVIHSVPAKEKEAEAWSEPFNVDLDGKTVKVQKNLNTGKLQSVAQGSSPPITINFDKDVVKQNIKELPKLKEEARLATAGVQRIDKMLGLIEKGAGGRLGQAKAWLNPTLEIFGVKDQGYSDAQLYQILARSLGGSMRMEIVGPGAVSDYENRLMQAVSGGGGTGTEAAKELLSYYRGLAEAKINNYNNVASSVGDVSPASKKSNKPIVINEPPEKKRYKFNPLTGQLE